MGYVWKAVKVSAAMAVTLGALLLVGSFAISWVKINSMDALPLSPLAYAAAIAPPCSAHDFTLTGTRLRWNRDVRDILEITGTVTNNASVACGVQLKISGYDAHGALVGVHDPWPFSIRNIAPGAKENFSTTMHFDTSAKKFDVVPVDARVWQRY